MIDNWWSGKISTQGITSWNDSSVLYSIVCFALIQSLGADHGPSLHVLDPKGCSSTPPPLPPQATGCVVLNHCSCLLQVFLLPFSSLWASWTVSLHQKVKALLYLLWDIDGHHTASTIFCNISGHVPLSYEFNHPPSYPHTHTPSQLMRDSFLRTHLRTASLRHEERQVSSPLV